MHAVAAVEKKLVTIENVRITYMVLRQGNDVARVGRGARDACSAPTTLRHGSPNMLVVDLNAWHADILILIIIGTLFQFGFMAIIAEIRDLAATPMQPGNDHWF